MTERIKLLREQPYTIKNSNTKRIVIKKDQIMKPSTFSLKHQNIFSEGTPFKPRDFQNYSLEKSISSIE